MRATYKGVTVHKGDRVTVEANVPGGHSYWKQYLDGGQVIEVNGESVTNNKRRDQ